MSRLIIFLLKLYQSTPTHLHSACRFTPTCSSYAIESYEKYGFFKGSALTIKRLFRCTPFGNMGYDPVPNRRRK